MAKVPVIDAAECTACENCVDICPEVFAMSDDGETAVVKDAAGAPESKIQEAIDECPVECISWK
jgi:ferredoxin